MSALSGIIGIAGGLMVLRRPAVGILIYLTTFLFTYPEFLRGSGNFTINNILGLLLLPIMLVGMLRDGDFWAIRYRPLVLLAGVVVCMIGSGIYYTPSNEIMEQRDLARIEQSARTQGPALIATRDAGTKFLTRYVFLAFFVFFIRTPRDAKMVAWAIIGCLMATYLSLSAEAGPFGWGTGRLRVMGESGLGLYAGRNPNKLAYFALFCLTLLWYMRKSIKSPGWYPLWGLVFAITFIIIPLTGSRSGLLNLLIFIAIVLMEGRFNYRKVAGLSLIALFIVVQVGFGTSVVDLLFPSDVADRLTRFDVRAEALESGLAARGSAEGRIQTATAAFRIFTLHPFFGVGIGNFNTERAATDPSGTIGPPHNSYLWTLAEGGLVVFMLFAMFYWWLWRELRNIEWEYEARYGEVGMGWMVNAMRTALIGFLFFSLFADMWHHVLFYIVMGLAISVVRMHQVYSATGKVPEPFILGPVLQPVLLEPKRTEGPIPGSAGSRAR